MRAALTGQQRQQGENAGISRGAERQRRQSMRAPSQRADDMAEPPDGDKGVIQHAAADRIVDGVEATAVGQPRDKRRHRFRTIDELGAKTLDRRLAPRRSRCEQSGAAGPSDLDRHLADAPGASQNQ
jgi:hypothetical protein